MTETEPLPWYYALALVALGVVLLVVVGVTTAVAMDALSGQPTAIETVTGESGSEVAEALENHPSPWEQFTDLLINPGTFVMLVSGWVLMALFMYPYLEWKRRRPAE